MVMNSWHPSAMILCPEEFSSTPGLQQKLIPGFNNFEDKFRMEFLPIVNAFKVARLFNPERITESKLTA